MFGFRSMRRDVQVHRAGAVHLNQLFVYPRRSAVSPPRPAHGLLSRLLPCYANFSAAEATFQAGAGYATNRTFLNHCIVAFWKRISSAEHLNLEPMLYQVSCAMHEIHLPRA